MVPKKIISLYNDIKENIAYSWPAHWVDTNAVEKTKKGHCGMKAELLAHKLKELGYKVRFVVGYQCGMIPRFLWPKFLDVHFWIEVQLDGKWLALDPTPDKACAFLIGDTQPGTHIGEPEYTQRLSKIPVWYKDIYNSWLIMPYKILVNMGLALIRLYLLFGRLICQDKR